MIFIQARPKICIIHFLFVILQRKTDRTMIYDDIHSALATRLAEYDQVCVVADENVSAKGLQAIAQYPLLRLKVSEETKNLETVTHIWDFMLAQRMTRRGVLVCIGGGVLTDLGGFAAATYKRGIRYINVPTTLLAMVDASTGGKTGCNYGGLKNCIGAFHAPVETLICPSFLSTLPAAQMLSGFAEMLKTGLVSSEPSAIRHPHADLWAGLLQYDLERMDIAALTPLIEACVAAKTHIVAADPQEDGLRKALNLGHTVGHALEEMSLSAKQSFRPQDGLLHGYAVLYGMIAELYLSVTLLGCPREPLHQLTQIMLHAYGRPDCKCSDRERLVALMQQDKKNERAAQINCTLIRDIGQPVINQVITPEQMNEALDYLFSL